MAVNLLHLLFPLVSLILELCLVIHVDILSILHFALHLIFVLADGFVFSPLLESFESMLDVVLTVTHRRLSTFRQVHCLNLIFIVWRFIFELGWSLRAPTKRN